MNGINDCFVKMRSHRLTSRREPVVTIFATAVERDDFLADAAVAGKEPVIGVMVAAPGGDISTYFFSYPVYARYRIVQHGKERLPLTVDAIAAYIKDDDVVKSKA